jgi:hypothetical protein
MTLTLVAGHDIFSRSAAVATSLTAIISANSFQVIKGWRDELKDTYSSKGYLVFSLE